MSEQQTVSSGTADSKSAEPASANPAQAKIDADRAMLVAAQSRGPVSTLFAFTRLSGPGWLQSAITLGGGSLASSLYLGVIAGFALLWVQPVAMILGIIMLSGIAYVTLSTGERPFRAINEHVNPVLGWGWALSVLAANMFWCLPQYSLADGVLQQNLLPAELGPGGVVVTAVGNVLGPDHWLAVNAGKLVIAISILVVTTLITWSYDSGRWGIKLYEFVLKLMVAGIVACFAGVIYALRNEIAWGDVAWGFLPDLTKLWEPSDEFLKILEGSASAEFWKGVIVDKQRDVMISAAATAVGINMTFLFPYSLLSKGWSREFRGLAKFDLSTGMFIPYVLATSCVVMAAAGRFHTQPVAGFLGETDADGAPIVASDKVRAEYYRILAPRLEASLGKEDFAKLAGAEETYNAALSAMPADRRDALSPAVLAALKADLGRVAVERQIDLLPEEDRRVAAMLINRSAFDLAQSLSPLTGDRVANLVFGLGVLGMTLSTITLLMLISGFVVCEIFNLPQGGWSHRMGCMAAATGVLGPFVWNEASFYLAVYVSVFGMMLLPIAYLSFLLLMNQRSLLGADMPRGRQRWAWNLLLLLAAGVATYASLYSVWQKTGRNGMYVMAAFLVLALLVQIVRAIRRMPLRA